ncbi:MAG: hypothetical protein K5669_03730 [Lachnospiraceae bacterium]|nr:hypothetical protein [Lachnospiraceae bacterium]
MNYIENLKSNAVVKEAAEIMGCPLSLADMDPNHDKGINYWFLLYVRYIALKLEKESIETVRDTDVLRIVAETKFKNVEMLTKDVLSEFSAMEECGRAEYDICAPHIKRAPIYQLYGAHKKIVGAFERACQVSA